MLLTTPTKSVKDWSRFSHYKRIVIVVVYCLRFRSKQRRIVPVLERQKTAFLILQKIQRGSYAELFSEPGDNTGEKVKHELAKL